MSSPVIADFSRRQAISSSIPFGVNTNDVIQGSDQYFEDCACGGGGDKDTPGASRALSECGLVDCDCQGPDRWVPEPPERGSGAVEHDICPVSRAQPASGMLLSFHGEAVEPVVQLVSASHDD